MDSKSTPPAVYLEQSKETLAEKREHHRQTCFNKRVADSLPLDRELRWDDGVKSTDSAQSFS